ncbi:MAG: type I-C CRISPR-associated protein Cas7/Csd2 [Deferribacteraceae bacterium]|jgi:CRISPR-associated protein Csd2|nr:type I-C CRISPR-associated protein Cas7/Csd2 [Deferribacteraceae bacterium]
MSNIIKSRFDFVFLFDVKDGNPNGDPDLGNLPRADPENQDGLVSDVCIKRKVRNYVQLKHGLNSPYDIFIRQGSALNTAIEKARGDTLETRQKDLCANYYDIRTFGAVMSTGKKPAGTVRGPVQFTFARSIDRIYQAEHSITRCAVTKEEDLEKQMEKDREYASTFGRKSTVPYALYLMHGFVSAVDAIISGFTEDDLNLLWEALINAFEHDRAAARGEISSRKLIVFEHDNKIGRARSIELFERVKISSLNELPRKYSDYSVTVNSANLPMGVKLLEKL